MKTINTTMHNIFKISLVACLLVLGSAQAQAVTYTPARTKPIYQQALTGGMYSTAASPTTVSFHSTSAYSSDKWMESTTPLINADGSINSETYVKPRRLGESEDDDTEGGQTGTPGQGGNNQQPVEDAVLPLLLMAAAFCLIRRKEIV